MSRRDPSRGRRTQARAAERRQLKAGRGGPAVLQVPERIQELTEQTKGETRG